MLISLYLVQYKYVKTRFKNTSPIIRNVSKNFYVCVDEPIVLYVPFFNTVHAISVWITYVNFKIFEDYLRELELAQTNKETECLNTFNFAGKCYKRESIMI